MVAAQAQFEQKILQLSSGNMLRQNDKEAIMIMLQSVVKQMKGIRPPGFSLAQQLNQIESMESRQKVENVLQ